MPKLEGYRFGRLVVNGEEKTCDVIVLPAGVVTNSRLADINSSWRSSKYFERDFRSTWCRYWLLRAEAPRSGRRASPPYGGGAGPGVATGLVVMSSPSGANIARSTLAIAYGTLSADQKPRSVSGDNAPPSTRNRIPRGATSSSNSPAQRTLALHRLRTRICPSSIEATIKIKNAIKKINGFPLLQTDCGCEVAGSAPGAVKAPYSETASTIQQLGRADVGPYGTRRWTSAIALILASSIAAVARSGVDLLA